MLEQCPGEPLCDACLAFACAVSLTEMRVVTSAVAHDAPFTRATQTCVSCRRQTTTLAWDMRLADEDCASCSRPIDASDEAEVRSQALIRKSRELGLDPLEDTSAEA